MIEGFPSELSVNGYQKLPSGLVQQWGKTTATTDGQGNLSITPRGIILVMVYFLVEWTWGSQATLVYRG